MKGVYFLLKGDDVIYIGQSADMETRIRNHRDKDYDAYVLIPSKHRKQLERKMIKLIKPCRNIVLFEDMTNFVLRLKPQIYEIISNVAAKQGVSIQTVIKETIREKYTWI